MREFWERHPDVRQPLLNWYRIVALADWEAPHHVRETFGTADFIRGNRVVFNIKGRTYRLVVRVNYPYRVVYIRFIGTHAEYDAIDAGMV